MVNNYCKQGSFCPVLHVLPANSCPLAVLNMPKNDFLMLKYDKRKIQMILNMPSDNAGERVEYKTGYYFPLYSTVTSTYALPTPL